MVEAILKDKKLVVPVKLGRNGIEQILQVELNPEEQTMLEKSVELIRGTMSALRL